jgi:hypothetical protein
MPKKIDPSILQALYARLSLQELRDTRDNLLAQLDILNRLIADCEVSDNG